MMWDMGANKRHSKNAPGPFYVVQGECISCRTPESVAGGLMSYDEGRDNGCFFVRQPVDESETSAAVLAVQASCCGAVRYGGKDPEILRRLAALDCSYQLDHADLVVGKPSLSTCARFRFLGEGNASSQEILQAIMFFIRQCLADCPVQGDDEVVKIGETNVKREQASLRYSWRNRYGRTAIRFIVAREPDDCWILRIQLDDGWFSYRPQGSTAAVGYAMHLNTAMRKDSRFRSIGWLSPEESEDLGFRGRPLPY